MASEKILSATKANNLFWLGRYESRVYMTLHLMNKVFDKMIDGSPADYMDLWNKLDMTGIYDTPEAFTLGMLYDEDNPSSLISSQRLAMDNAILLREDIMSESLSYLEMSTALLRKSKAVGETNISELQSVIDWSLAFWGSAELRTRNIRAIVLMILGRNVELMDMLIRFGYPYNRVETAFGAVKRYAKDIPEMVDENILGHVEAMFVPDQYEPESDEYKYTLLKYVNQIARV